MTLRDGTTFGAYRIESLLGRGGMGEVYRATDTRLGRPVALKLITGDLAERPGIRARFLAESRLAASLDHPHIVPIYEAGESEGRLYLAMRFVAGSDLEAILRSKRALTPDRAVGLLRGVSEALDAAHERGLVHRDVKPSNILVAKERAGAEHAYLGDFGLVKQLASGTGFTASGQLLGSVDFVAPEQVEGRPIDGRVDVYSLACVLYTALTGRVPFPRNSDMATLWAHVQTPPPKPSEVDPALVAFDSVIARGMAKDPDERYPTAGELMAAAAGAVDSWRAPETRAAAGQLATVRTVTPGRAMKNFRIGGAVLATAIVVAGAVWLGGRTGLSPSSSSAASPPGSPPTGAAPTQMERIVFASEFTEPGVEPCRRDSDYLESRLNVVAPDGAGRAQLAIEGDLFARAPAWRPDGSAIAFSGSETLSDIYLWSVGDATLANLTGHREDDEDSRTEQLVSWSPQGDRVVWADGRVRTLDIDSGVVRTILQPSTGHGSVLGLRAGGAVITADTSAPPGESIEPLPPSRGPGSPPDSAYLAAWRADGRIALVNENQVWTMTPDGADLQLAFQTALTSITWMSWSPTGEHVALAATVDPPPEEGALPATDIFVLGSDGSGMVNVSAHPSVDRTPAWSPDGKRLAFVRDGSGLYTVARDGSGLQRILPAGQAESLCAPNWGRTSTQPQSLSASQPFPFSRGRLRPGVYRASVLAPAVEFGIGDGWQGYIDRPDDVSFQDVLSGQTEVTIARLQVGNGDPCAAAQTGPVPVNLDPGPRGVFDWLRSRPEIVVNNPYPVNVDAATGLVADVAFKGAIEKVCHGQFLNRRLHLFLVGDDSIWIREGQRLRVWALDVRGTTMTVLAGAPDDVFESTMRDRIEPIVASLAFD